MSRQDDEEVVVVERQGSFIAPFLWGLGIGAVLGLLFAPMKGSELRSEIAARGRRLRDYAGEKMDEIEEVIASGYSRARGKVEEGVESARRTVKEGREYARDVAEAGKAAASTARDELERRLAEAREARRARSSGEEEPVA